MGFFNRFRRASSATTQHTIKHTLVHEERIEERGHSQESQRNTVEAVPPTIKRDPPVKLQMQIGSNPPADVDHVMRDDPNASGVHNPIGQGIVNAFQSVHQSEWAQVMRDRAVQEVRHLFQLDITPQAASKIAADLHSPIVGLEQAALLHIDTPRRGWFGRRKKSKPAALTLPDVVVLLTGLAQSAEILKRACARHLRVPLEEGTSAVLTAEWVQAAPDTAAFIRTLTEMSAWVRHSLQREQNRLTVASRQKGRQVDPSQLQLVLANLLMTALMIIMGSEHLKAAIRLQGDRKLSGKLDAGGHVGG